MVTPVAGTSTWPIVQVRYPAGPITPAGAYHILHDHLPNMAYRSYDNTAVFNVYGGMAIYDHTTPESVQVTDMKGLVPPWQKISQKGATQDGETFITSLYDPIEVDLTVRIRGRDGSWTRRVQRDWIAAWDAIQPGELSWWSHDLGFWWAKVRWSKNPADKLTGGNQLPQSFVWPAIAYDAFWRSYDCVGSFGYEYAAVSDIFDEDNATGLTGWTIGYSGAGGWISETSAAGLGLDVLGIVLETPQAGGAAEWTYDPDNAVGGDGVDAVAINDTFVSETDDQVVTLQLGSMPTWFFNADAFDDIWLRTPEAGTETPGQNGVRLRFGWGLAELSYFIDGVKTILRATPLFVPPLPGEIWKVATSGRTFTVYRQNALGTTTVMTVVEADTSSQMGEGFRSAGAGMYVTAEAIPGAWLAWTAGDNNAVVQSGYIPMVNMGDQPMFWRATLYGPGTFQLGNGPNATEYVTVGPLAANQTVQVNTDPRKRSIVNITNTPNPSTTTALTVDDLISDLATFNVTALISAVESVFGITPADINGTSNVYSLLNGRFSDAAAIPAKPVAGDVTQYEIPVSITGGNADSQIIFAGTPLRRFPY